MIPYELYVKKTLKTKPEAEVSTDLNKQYKNNQASSSSSQLRGQ